MVGTDSPGDAEGMIEMRRKEYQYIDIPGIPAELFNARIPAICPYICHFTGVFVAPGSAERSSLLLPSRPGGGVLSRRGVPALKQSTAWSPPGGKAVFRSCSLALRLMSV